jgi:hypothetical protein
MQSLGRLRTMGWQRVVGTIPANALYQVRPDSAFCKVWVGWGV